MLTAEERAWLDRIRRHQRGDYRPTWHDADFLLALVDRLEALLAAERVMQEHGEAFKRLADS